MWLWLAILSLILAIFELIANCFWVAMEYPIATQKRVEDG